MKITQVKPLRKRVPPPATGGGRLVVTILVNDLVTRTRDDDI
jgi:hypothetical protein